MKPKLIISGGRIIDPSENIDKQGNIIIEDGKIITIQDSYDLNASKEYEVINATGCIVCPGFIDLHCHLREPGFENKETIATGTKAAAAGGFTTVCCMPNTNPPLDSEASLDYVKQRSMDTGVIQVLPVACITRGRQGKEISEMYHLAKAGAIAFSDDGEPISDSRVMYLAMQYSKLTDLPIIDHCEDKGLTQSGMMHEGWVSARLGLRGMPAAAEEIMIARDIFLAKETGAKLHIAHVSTKKSVELIRRAKNDGISVTAEVTPHHLILTHERVIWRSEIKGASPVYDTNAKVNPPLRTEEDIEELISGLKDGTLDAIATDHAPHALVDKKCEFDIAAFGISGFETALAILMRLVHENKMELSRLIYYLTLGPAKIIGQEKHLGNLKKGNDANITIVHPEMIWTIDSNNFYSKGKNTPFDGMTVKGKVLCTIYRGEIVYKQIPFDEKI